jgi:hypothetical protein
MYRRPTGQMVIEDFVLPFEGKFDANNRWVKLSKMIPWERIETDYADLFPSNVGTVAKPVMDSGDPFLQFGRLVEVVVALVSLLVLPPVPSVAPVKADVAEVGDQRRGTRPPAPSARARPRPRRPC